MEFAIRVQRGAAAYALILAPIVLAGVGLVEMTASICCCCCSQAM